MNKSNYVIAGSLIMLIDDEVMVLEILAEVFRAKGAQVVTATCATDAYQKIKQITPDIIICDYKLGNGQDGGELLNDLSFIKNNTPLCIMMSGDPSLKNADVNDIAVSLLRKPFSVEDVFNVVQNARNGLDYLKEVVNLEAYRFSDIEFTMKIANQLITGEFVEAKQESIVISTPKMVPSLGNCHLLIKNFLNNNQLEFLIEGEIFNMSDVDGCYWVEVKIKDSYMINWKKIYTMLEKKQNEITDFIKKANG